MVDIDYKYSIAKFIFKAKFTESPTRRFGQIATYVILVNGRGGVDVEHPPFFLGGGVYLATPFRNPGSGPVSNIQTQGRLNWGRGLGGSGSSSNEKSGGLKVCSAPNNLPSAPRIRDRGENFEVGAEHILDKAG